MPFNAKAMNEMDAGRDRATPASVRQECVCVCVCERERERERERSLLTINR